jgi:hypothetical protein
MANEHGEAAPENEPNGRKRIPLTTACEYRKESPLAAGGTSRPAGELAGARVRGGFYFLPHFTWDLYDLPLFTLESIFCPYLLGTFMIVYNVLLLSL